ncbi:sigma 54-interacting transcriptional regulator [candidate division KSB1 bacterium]|nr:sigma 54-interacting transcriptional regulator [candidate division KSB1 bacterium]
MDKEAMERLTFPRREGDGLSFESGEIVSRNPLIQQIFEILPDVADSDCTVLIQGPSGSGKELFAQAIHAFSPRCAGPFVPVNCSAIPETLLESELFGYTKGAFTDAKKDKPGRFAMAESGTLFLDEIESMSPAVQVKLLRVLQEHEFEPLGATSPARIDVRVIAAAKESLAQLVGKELFRDDLYFRLNVFRIDLPPLKERLEDIPLLIPFLIKKFDHRFHRHIKTVSDDALEILMQYSYPGNVRELENIIEHAFVICHSDTIESRHLPEDCKLQSKKIAVTHRIGSPLEFAERQVVREMLDRFNGNKSATAQALGIHRCTLWRKMKRFGLL